MFKIQRWQLRLAHADQQYCNILLKHFNHRAIDFNNDNVKVHLFFCDNKAKVKVGKSGFAISSGVRGWVTITPTYTTLVAGDHDMNNVSLTPLVNRNATIPKTLEESLERGEVLVTENDSVFEGSNPFRHPTSLVKSTSGKDVPNIPK
jgi:hypothetical protein